MNIVVALAPEWAGKKPEVGDFLKLQIFLDEKVGSEGDAWEIVAPSTSQWTLAGSLTVSTVDVRALPTDANATKIQIQAMVHQPGALVLGAIQLRNQVTKAEINVPETVISGTEVSAGTKPREEPPWLAGPVRFGGWDWTLLSIFFAIFLGVLLVLGRIFWRKLRGHLEKNFTNTERALHSIANLQKYARSKNALQLEEWKKFSFELAGVLRKYSDENFGIDSSDLTDMEFLRELGHHDQAAPQLGLLTTILGTITEVRYGKKELDASVVPGLLLDARKFVQNTSKDNKEEKK